MNRTFFRFAFLLSLLPMFACGKKGTGTVGAACKAGKECREELYCVTGAPGGLCSTDCVDGQCAEGQACWHNGADNFCVPACSDRSACRADWQCRDGACVPGCTAPTDCGERGFSCDDGQCNMLPGAENGQPCTFDEDCSSQTCIEGVCRKPCDNEGACGVDDTCALNAMGDNGETSPTTQIRPACIPRRNGAEPGKTCATDDDCDQGTCQFNFCTLLCNAETQCGSTATCSTTAVYLDSGIYPNTKVCLPVGMLSMPVLTNMVSVPSTAQSLALFVTLTKTTDYENIAGVASLTEPSGTEVYTVPQSDNEFYEAMIRYYPTEISSTMLVPNSPAYALAQGMYTFIAGSSKGGAMNVTSYLKIAKAPITTGTLKLNFYVSDLADGACDHARVTVDNGAQKLSAVIAEIKSIYAQANITITDVTWHTTTATNTITIDDPGSLGRVLEAATKNQPTEIGMDIVLIRSIGQSGNPSLVTLGVAGGIPSSPVLGNPHSGVVVAMDAACDYGSDWADTLASTIAHEAGHSMGLFHNVEQTGDRDAITDNNTDGGKNLMYWLEYGGSRISAQQAEVLRHDPKVKQ